ncbi:MAG: hypothetical protein XD90_1369 [Methanobacterium sp. 42_16]|jgi:hypothetical protein|nr:MAG: hypothetical protein XD90_1369 [Methanobacterium sp. 42_16]
MEPYGCGQSELIYLEYIEIKTLEFQFIGEYQENFVQE